MYLVEFCFLFHIPLLLILELIFQLQTRGRDITAFNRQRHTKHITNDKYQPFFYHSAGCHVYFQHPPSSVAPPGASALKLLATSTERWQRLQTSLSQLVLVNVDNITVVLYGTA